jgi:hypothetical protein
MMAAVQEASRGVGDPADVSRRLLRAYLHSDVAGPDGYRPPEADSTVAHVSTEGINDTKSHKRPKKRLA